MASAIQKAMQEALQKRMETSIATKDSGGKFKSIYMDNSKVNFWKPEAGDLLIDILPYKAGDNDPICGVGEYTYILDLWVHYNIGVNDDQFVCIRQYNETCPICEHVKTLRQMEERDDEIINHLKGKRRSIYWIISYSSKKDEDMGPQVWDVAHFYAESNILPIAKQPRGGGKIAFYDPWEGKSIAMTLSGKQMNTSYKGWAMVDRDYTISDKILGSLVPIDSLIRIPTAQELIEALGVQNIRTSETTSPRRGKTETPMIQEQNIRGGENPPLAHISEKTEECPAGGEFGADFNQLDFCPECPNYDDCAVKSEQDKASRMKAVPTRRSSVAPQEPIEKPTTTRRQNIPAEPEPEPTQPIRRRRPN